LFGISPLTGFTLPPLNSLLMSVLLLEKKYIYIIYAYRKQVYSMHIKYVGDVAA